MASLKEQAEKILAAVDITISGGRPWDPQVHNERVYSRVFSRGALGLGESYMDSWWDCERLDEFFIRFLADRYHATHHVVGQEFFHWLNNFLFNRQSVERAFEVGERHYDLGNDLFEAMLDKRMAYSCGYWQGAKNLDEAQEHKLDLICKKLQLKPGQHVLDIGCGWGSFAIYAAQKYGVRVTGITISKEQAALAQKMAHGLPVTIRVQDYRGLEGVYDHIVSVGMFEHVGHKNYRQFMEIAHRHLADTGMLLLHTIGGNFSGHNDDPWLEKYIFPGGILPQMSHIAVAIDKLFVMEDWHNFGADYDTTLMAWHHNFNAHWPQLQGRYSERFRRMWNYYLLVCAALFRARENQLWQIVLTKGGRPGGYTSVR